MYHLHSTKIYIIIVMDIIFYIIIKFYAIIIIIYAIIIIKFWCKYLNIAWRIKLYFCVNVIKLERVI